MTDKLKRSQKQAYEKQIKSLQALADRQSSEIKKLQDDLLWKNLLADCVLDTQERAEKAEAERDAAIIDLKLFAGCVACRHYCNHRRDHQESLLLTCCDCEKKQNCKCGSCSLGRSRWEWRGLPEPEGGEKA